MNKEKRNEYQKKYREQHKEKYKEYQKKYWAEHGEEINAKRRNRKAYKFRCNKAIEYLEELKNFKIKYVMLEEKELYASEKDFVSDLLNILRGDKNE